MQSTTFLGSLRGWKEASRSRGAGRCASYGRGAMKLQITQRPAIGIGFAVVG